MPLLQAQTVTGPVADIDDAEFRAGLLQDLVDLLDIFRGYVELPAQLANVGGPECQGGRAAQLVADWLFELAADGRPENDTGTAQSLRRHGMLFALSSAQQG